MNDEPYRAPETADVTPRSVIRVLAFLLAVLASVSLVFPNSKTSHTQIGFAEGSPDPNTHTTTYTLGWPLPWCTRQYSWNESRGGDRYGSGSFNGANLTLTRPEHR
jgi:hypothetical protein